MDGKLYGEGPSRGSHYPFYSDEVRRRSNKVDKNEENEENAELNKNFKKTISLLKCILKVKYEAPRKWKPEDWQPTQNEQQNYDEALKNLNQIEQWLPKILLKEPSEAKDNIIKAMEKLPHVQFERYHASDIYKTISIIHDKVKRLADDHISK